MYIEENQPSQPNCTFCDCLNACNESSGILHRLRVRRAIIVAISIIVLVVLALAIGLGTGIGLQNVTTIAEVGAVDASTQDMKNYLNNSEDATWAAVVGAVDAATQDIKNYLNNIEVPCKPHAGGLDIFVSCDDIQLHFPNAASGVYTVYPGGRQPGRFVCCDLETDGGGWTLFQRRQDGTVPFNRTWEEYQQGFGSVQGEFWFGNDDLHRLTTAQPSELRVDLWDWDGAHRFAKYSRFSVGGQSTNYQLSVDGYSGDAGDSLAYHNNMVFSTIDRDHDTWGANCAATYGGGGGWWFGTCANLNLNGRYYSGSVSVPYATGVFWYDWRGYFYSYKAATMMTRPRQ